MPTVQDIPQLPYLTAFLHELLRFRPILPTGFSHAATQDDKYNGFRVPRAAQIVTNTWLMDSDESLYPGAPAFALNAGWRTLDYL
ncbi:cytochrome P450 [Penicillium canescens]|nr:cytochrome P450 [Penicillium canescens]